MKKGSSLLWGTQLRVTGGQHKGCSATYWDLSDSADPVTVKIWGAPPLYEVGSRIASVPRQHLKIFVKTKDILKKLP